MKRAELKHDGGQISARPFKEVIVGGPERVTRIPKVFTGEFFGIAGDKTTTAGRPGKGDPPSS
jgi:hypothetical protein